MTHLHSLFTLAAARRTAAYLALSALLLAHAPAAQAGFFDFLKRKSKAKKEQPKKTPYEEITTKAGIMQAHSPFLTLYAKGADVWLDVPQEQLGRDFLMAATISSVTNPGLGIVGFKPDQPKQLRLVRKGENLVLQWANGGLMPLYGSSPLTQATMQDQYLYTDIAAFKIEGWSKDSTSCIVKVSPFLYGDNKFFKTVSDRLNSYQIVGGNRSELNAVKRVRAFPSNVSVEVEQSKLTRVSSKGQTLRDFYPLTYRVTYSLLQLPERAMVPRLSDNRIGVFQTTRTIIDARTGLIERKQVANRWRLEPTDTAAFMRGELTTVIKPIVWYIDPAFPEPWKAPIFKAVTNWNKAFERIGLKDVMQARLFPTAEEDSTFDPNDLAYSCLRYNPSPTQNAFGPSWVDTRSGEIVNASVVIYSDVAKLIQQWLFAQTSQVDESVRSGVLPDSVFDHALTYVVTHEIGHTLGFMHDMSASSSVPVDSLRSASFTQKYGTTPSIMDYARWNYVAQPGDKGVRISPPDLGIYDYYAVDWLYRPFPQMGGDPVAEAVPLDSLVESHVRDPRFRYVMQQMNDRRIDPSAIEEDLGDDPIRASEYGLANLRFIIAHMNEWLRNDTTGTLLPSLYDEVSTQAYRYLSNVAMMVGGIRVHPTSEASGLPRYEVLPREQQRKAAQWLLKQARLYGEMGNAEIEAKLPAGTRPFKTMEPAVRALALTRVVPMSLSSYLDSTTYQPLEYLEDVYSDVFAKTLRNDTQLTEADRSLQNSFVELLKRAVQTTSKASQRSNLQGLTDGYDLFHISAAQWDATLPHSTHSMGCSHASAEVAQSGFTSAGFGEGYGENNDMWLASVDKTAQNLFLYAKRIRALLKRTLRTQLPTSLRGHYAFLLRQLDDAE